MGSFVLRYDVRLRDDTGRFIAVYNAEMERAVEEAAKYLADLARLYAPKDTGALAASIDVIAYGKSAEVHAGTDHAAPQEFGARPHPIPNAFGWGITVMHPGNPATHFLELAAAAARPFFVRSVESHFPA